MVSTEIWVSVYCTTYNQAKYVRQALEGILMQRTTFRYQIVIHDDASSDGTDKIIEEYHSLYPDIIVPILEKENQYRRIGYEGIYAIMKPYLKGKYIAYCEGDDYWIDPLKLQKQVDFLETNKSFSLCGTNGFVYWDNLDRAPYYFNSRAKGCELYPREVAKFWQLPTASIVHRRDLRDNYPSWVNNVNFWDFALVLVASARGGVYYMPDVTCVYRRSLINKFSASNTYGKKNKEVAEKHLKLIKDFDEWTGHSLCLEEAIKWHSDGLKYSTLREKNRYLPYFLMPGFAWKMRKEVRKTNT